MTQTQHTPGLRPKLVDERPKGCTCSLSFQDGVRGGVGEFGRKVCPQCAAAPELVEALQQASAIISRTALAGGLDRETYDSTKDQIRALLSRVKP